MVIVHAYFKVKDGKQEKFLYGTKEIIEESNKEKGNIMYNLYESVDIVNSFIMVEKWTNNAALEEHESFDYFKRFQRESKNFLEESPRVEVFNTYE